MELQLNFVHVDADMISDHDFLLDSLQSQGLDAFRTFDPKMEEVAATLTEIFGQEFPAHSAITVTVESGNLELQDQLTKLAYLHGLVVFLGTTDILVNATGIDISSAGLASLTNSMGTVWRQVSKETVDRAFEDAIRLPVGEQTWVQVINHGSDSYDYGVDMSMRLLTNGRCELVWTSLPAADAAPVFRSLTVGSYEEARELLLSFSDHNPLIAELDWEPLAQRPQKNFLDAGFRHELPWRRLDAVKELPAGVMVHLHAWPTMSLAYGRNAQGQWAAMAYDHLGTENVQTFDIADEAIAVAEHYLGGNGETFFEIFPASSVSDPAPYTTVTAMELPEREEQWTEASLCTMHRIRAAHNDEPGPRMQQFISAVNAKLGSEILLAEEHVEPHALTRLLIPAEVTAVTLERLAHVASNYGVSLVVDDTMALYNPSGRALPNAEKCTLTLLSENRYVNTWETTTPSAVTEAALRLFPGWRLKVMSGRNVDFQERYALEVRQQDGGFEVDLAAPDGGMYAIPDIPLPYALEMIVEFTYGPAQMVDKVNWERSQTPADVSEEERFVLSGTLTGRTPYLFEERLLNAVRGEGLSEVGTWAVVHDRLVPGDYCQVDRVEPAESGAARYLVEWGHNNGEEEHFQMLLEDIDQALSLLHWFAQGNRAEFEALPWTRQEGQPH